MQCKLDGCAKEEFEGGLCQKHYTSELLLGQKRYQRGKKRAGRKLAPIARPGEGLRFLKDNLDYVGDACLIFPFGNNPATALVTWLGNEHGAAKLMCRFKHGTPPDGKGWALHSCGNGHLGCVNPNHLYWGDESDNAKDASRHAKEGKGVEFDIRTCRTSRQGVEFRRVAVENHMRKQASR